MNIEATGIEDITQGLREVLKAVPHLEPRTVSQVILAAARSRAPVETGRLRASGRAHGMTVTYTAPYSAPIHWGWRQRHIQPNPWLIKGAEASLGDWQDAYAEALQVDLDRTL